MVARAAGDDVLEVVALHRCLQAHFLDADMADDHLRHLDRLDELSPTVPFALGAAAHARSQLAQYAGDAEGALAVLDEFSHLAEIADVVNRNQRLCDLGRPEDVAVGLTTDDLAQLAPGSEMFIAFAMWLRGDGSPEFANEFVGAMLDDVDGRGFDHTMISTLGTATSIALAAGDTTTARRHCDQARDLVQRDSPRTIELFDTIARASFEADQLSDDAAAAILHPDRTPVADRSLAASRPPARPSPDLHRSSGVAGGAGFDRTRPSAQHRRGSRPCRRRIPRRRRHPTAPPTCPGRCSTSCGSTSSLTI